MSRDIHVIHFTIFSIANATGSLDSSVPYGYLKLLYLLGCQALGLLLTAVDGVHDSICAYVRICTCPCCLDHTLHMGLNYRRWDNIEVSSEESDSEAESAPEDFNPSTSTALSAANMQSPRRAPGSRKKPLFVKLHPADNGGGLLDAFYERTTSLSAYTLSHNI